MANFVQKEQRKLSNNGLLLLQSHQWPNDEWDLRLFPVVHAHLLRFLCIYLWSRLEKPIPKQSFEIDQTELITQPQPLLPFELDHAKSTLLFFTLCSLPLTIYHITMTMSAGLRARMIRCGGGRSPNSPCSAAVSPPTTLPTVIKNEVAQAPREENEPVITQESRLQSNIESISNYVDSTQNVLSKVASAVGSGLPATFNFSKGFSLTRSNHNSEK